MNFNSQICTSREQSERLLALGLKKETADMVHYRSSSMKEWGILATPWRGDCEGCKCYYPAWSLHRLLEIWDVNPYVLPSKNIFEHVISKIEEFVRLRFIDTRYLDKWCLDEDE